MFLGKRETEIVSLINQQGSGTVKDLAERFGCDPSTISRTVDGKWMQTPRGIVPMKALFTGEVPARDGLHGEEGASRSEAPWAAPLWDRMRSATEPLLVVFSNTIFHGTYEEGMRVFNSLDLIERGGDSAPLAQGAGPAGAATQPASESAPRIDHYTGIGEVMGVYFLSEFFARIRRPFRIKRSLLLTWDDAKIGNIVVLGSPAENWFLLDLPQKQDFVFRWERDEKGRNVNAIINTNPQPGEQERYLARYYGPSPSHVSEDYAVVSLLQGLSASHSLLILAGINTFGTQAAVEYVTRPECLRDLVSRLNAAPEGAPPVLPAHFQMLLRVKVNGGVPVQISYVTHHILTA